MAPLSDIRVADFSRILSGPFCTMVLADLGADVIKVERPGEGDDTRTWGPPFLRGDAAYFLSVNRNKRSVVLDLSRPTGRDDARRLVRSSDVVVENFRDGIMKKFGLDAATVRREHEALVYCSITAYSREGFRDLPGYDLAMQAATGYMSITGHQDGPPLKIGVAALDVLAGLYAAVGIIAALKERESTGRGRHLTVGLFDASVASLVNQAGNYLLGGMVPTRAGNEHPNIVPYQTFATKDRPIVVAAGNDKLFARTCHVIGYPELPDDPRFRTNSDRVENRQDLIRMMSAAFEKESSSYWLSLLAEQGVPSSAIRTLDEVFASPEGKGLLETVDNGSGEAFRFVRSPIQFDGDENGGSSAPTRLPPLLGEDTEDVLRELHDRHAEPAPPGHDDADT